MNRKCYLVICLFHWGSIIDILEIFTWYVVGQTATEIIYYNVNATKLHMGLTTWAQAPDGKIMKSDVAIAKNYLSEEHIFDTTSHLSLLTIFPRCHACNATEVF